jgi:hypothetical protein
MSTRVFRDCSQVGDLGVCLPTPDLTCCDYAVIIHSIILVPPIADSPLPPLVLQQLVFCMYDNQYFNESTTLQVTLEDRVTPVND